MNNILDFNKCANCGACYNVCPTKAIFVNEDSLYYQIKVDETKCVSCGLCKKVCPVNVFEYKQKPCSAYAVINNDENEVKTSSSGGAFSAIANYVIENGGQVYGAVFAENFKSVNICSTQDISLEKIKRSKYVESQVGRTFCEVKEKLQKGISVLYCGAPCQIAGLKRFLNQDYDNLITCDFSCGGVPSHKMFQEYLQWVEKKLRNKIIDVNFRAKIYGWINHSILIKTKKKKYKKWAFSDPYFNCFLKERLSMRDYCYECGFANNHYADIILADFWKFRDISNVRNDNKGISLVITNSPKGEEVIGNIKKSCAVTILDMDKSKYNLTDKVLNEELLRKHKQFAKSCDDNGFMKTVKKYKLKSSLNFVLKYKLKKLLGKSERYY